MNVFVDFLNFLRRPNDEQYDLSLSQKLKFFGWLFLLVIGITLVIVFPLHKLINYITPLRGGPDSTNFSLIKRVLLTVLLIPFFEELIFRKILRYSGLVWLCLSRQTWYKIFPYLVYVFSITFGIVHASNLENNDWVYYMFVPFLFISQLTGGFVLSYIRVRLNFWWGVLFHSNWNFIFAILLPLVSSFISKPYVLHTDNYNLQVVEKPFYDAEKPQRLQLNSFDSLIYNINANQQTLQSILDTLYGKGVYYADPVLLDLTIQSEQGITKDEFLNSIKGEYDIISLKSLKKIK